MESRRGDSTAERRRGDSTVESRRGDSTAELRSWPDPARFHAVSVDAPGLDPDVISLAARPGGTLVAGPDLAVAGVGVAAVLRLPGPSAPADARHVAAWLASVASADSEPDHPAEVRPGSGPVAVGALPFSPGSPASLVVPAISVVVRSGGPCTVTAVVDRSTPLPTRGRLLEHLRELIADRPSFVSPAGTLSPEPTPPSTTPPSSRGLVGPDPDASSQAQFLAAVRAALDSIAAGEVTKVVLARRVDARFDRAVDISAALRNLRRDEPRATVFAVHHDAGTFLGASPELLVSRRGRAVVSHPLAGTTALAGDADDAVPERLLGSPKQRQEHRVVVETVAAILQPLCTALAVPEAPEVLRLGTVAHLGTRLVGTLGRFADGVPDALELATSLHPTPAVAGFPTAAALDLLTRLESDERGRFAGPVGWVDARGDGDFVIGIRSADVDGASAAVYAGAGIVAGSDPHDELVETTVKLQVALAALDEADVAGTAITGSRQL